MENYNERKNEELADLILKKFKKAGVAKRVKKESAECFAAIIEYLLAELFEISIDMSILKNSVEIHPAFIRKAIDEDNDFSILLRNVFIEDTVIKHQDNFLEPSNNESSTEESINFETDSIN